MKLFSIFALCVVAVSAHTSMLYPLPRGHPQNPNAAENDTECITAPLNECKNSTKVKTFPCGGYPIDSKITQIFHAGEVINVSFWNSNFSNGPQPGREHDDQARHNGGQCEFSLSYDGGKTYTVIATYHKTCPDIYFNWTVKIPAAAPSCDNPGKCIFSWTWIPNDGQREFWQNCADVILIGTSTKPLPIIDITRANLPIFNINMTPPGDPNNTGNFKGSGPFSSDILANLALNIGGIDPASLPRDGSNAALIGKKIYFIGGKTTPPQKINTYLLDLTSDFIVTKPNFVEVFGFGNGNISSPVWTAACVKKEDETIYIFGGSDASQSTLPKVNTMYTIKLSNDTFLDWTTSLPNQGEAWPSARDGIVPVIDNLSRIFIWGGFNEEQDNKTMYVFESSNWKSYIFDNAPNPRASYSATLLDDGRIIYIGGISRSPYPEVNFFELLIFDTIKLEWNIQISKSDNGKPIKNRAHHSALLHTDSISIILYGGVYEPIENQIPNDDSLYILNTKTWTWSQQSIPSLPYMNVTRNHTAVMYDGYMIIALGVYGDGFLTPEVKVMDVTNLSSLAWVPTYKVRTIPTTGSTNITTEDEKQINKMLIIGCTFGGGLVIIAFVLCFIIMRRNKFGSYIITQNGRVSEDLDKGQETSNILNINPIGFPIDAQDPNPFISQYRFPMLQFDPLYKKYSRLYQYNPISLYMDMYHYKQDSSDKDDQ
ncbi:6301_t:CDS:2 [Ambispora leptoticha]|uniref:6301_t:CDS:1 n=1 Tax=Ambispora leptoticha TaxID=144679 RepID=A0A9N9BCM0_9GLOM|nr:6301_t:CDS:2 [Ambispora leptoticha]